MEVKEIGACRSPRGRDLVRLRAEVCYDGPGQQSEEYWFDVHETHAAELSDSGNPWLVCLLPLAATLGEPLRVAWPVDRPLLENASRVMSIWQAWYPQLAVVPLEAEPADHTPSPSPSRNAALFSGGVDSFFTALRPREHAQPMERTPVDDLITVWGFDIRLERLDACARLRVRHGQVARQLGKGFVEVATNLRSTRWNSADWPHVAHGCALASVALVLEKRFRTVLIAGGGGYRGLHPWGSHVITDPLLSTCRTAVVYDGAAFLRTEKLDFLAGYPVALQALRVCYESWSDENCGACNKCRRTMLTLALLDVLEQCPTFPRSTIDLDEIARMDCSHFADFREFEDIRRLALARGRLDVVRVLDHSMRRSRRRRRLLDGLRSTRRSIGRLVVPALKR